MNLRYNFIISTLFQYSVHLILHAHLYHFSSSSLPPGLHLHVLYIFPFLSCNIFTNSSLYIIIYQFISLCNANCFHIFTFLSYNTFTYCVIQDLALYIFCKLCTQCLYNACINNNVLLFKARLWAVNLKMHIDDEWSRRVIRCVKMNSSWKMHVGMDFMGDGGWDACWICVCNNWREK